MCDTRGRPASPFSTCSHVVSNSHTQHGSHSHSPPSASSSSPPLSFFVPPSPKALALALALALLALARSSSIKLDLVAHVEIGTATAGAAAAATGGRGRGVRDYIFYKSLYVQIICSTNRHRMPAQHCRLACPHDAEMLSSFGCPANHKCTSCIMNYTT